jgi:hypothetical protein
MEMAPLAAATTALRIGWSSQLHPGQFVLNRVVQSPVGRPELDAFALGQREVVRVICRWQIEAPGNGEGIEVERIVVDDDDWQTQGRLQTFLGAGKRDLPYPVRSPDDVRDFEMHERRRDQPRAGFKPFINVSIIAG